MSTTEEKKIVESAERLRKKFRVEQKKDSNDVKMSFVDEVNAHVRSIFHDSDISAYDALSQENLEKWKKRRFRRFMSNIRWNKIFMFLLLVTIIGFLVTEAVPFYAIDGVITTKTWVKAILTEVCFIFVSSIRAKGFIQVAMAMLARVGIFLLMLFVISSEVTMTGLNQVNEIDVIQEKIELIEEQIEKKEELIDFYLKKGWGINAKEQEKEKQELVDELMELKNQQIDGKNESASDLIVWNTWAKAFFRVMLISVSVLISRRLF